MLVRFWVGWEFFFFIPIFLVFIYLSVEDMIMMLIDMDGWVNGWVMY